MKSYLLVATTGICMALVGVSPNSLARGGAGTISGTVKSPAGVAISGAKVTIGNGQVSRLTFTAPDGTYSFSQLEAGNYKLTAESSGFDPDVRQIVLVDGVRPDAVDMTLGLKHSDPLAAAPAYDDETPLKPSAVHGAVDGGGYSSGAQAGNSRTMRESVAGLKNPAVGNSSAQPAALTPLDAAREADLKKALAASPGDFESNHNLGEFYLHAGRLTQGIPYLEKAEHIDSSHYDNGYDLALACLESGDFARARSQLGRLMARRDNAGLHDLMGDVEEHAGEYPAAAAEYERAAHMDPSEGNIFDWGSELLLHQTLDPAIAVFTSGVDRYPRSAMLLIGLGVAFYSRGRYDDAVKALCAASDISPSDPRPYFFLDKMYNVSTSNTEEVTTRLERFVKLDPENPLAHFDYAMSVWKGQRRRGGPVNFNQIETLLNRAIAVDRKFPDAHFELGNLYSEQKKYPAAIGEYRQALAVQPEMADAHYRLAQAYIRTGDQTLAQQEFEIHDRLRKQQVADTGHPRTEIKDLVNSVKGESKQ
ncbi:MAG TPA: tetratricopeptide repeat protein [Terriglobia bacterium]|nr:tetratricopeptide repeat protein [Terriglobia bacterium]